MMRNNKLEKKKLVLWVCLLLTIGLGLGYALLTEQLKLNGSVNYGAMSFDVGFTTAEDGGGTVTSSPSVSNDKKSVTVTCNVGTSTSSETCIAKAKIKNASSFAVELESNPTITFDSTYINSVTAVWTGNFANIVAGDSLGSNAEEEIQITITTKELTKEMLPESTLSLPVTITMDWVESSGDKSELYEGKVVSILGDSMSTLEGYIPEGNRARYVQTEAEAVSGLLYMPYEKTWWGSLIEELDMELGVNDSWAGTRFTNTSSTDTGDVGPNISMSSMTRLQKLDDNGTPNLILVYGGPNDIAAGVALGNFDPNLQLDTTTTIIDNFSDAFAMTILRLKYLYPDAEIVSLLGIQSGLYFDDAELGLYNNVMKNICDYYDVRYIDLVKSGVTVDNLSDGAHLDEYGMNLISQYVKDELINNSTSSKLNNLYSKTKVVDEFYSGTGQLTTMDGIVSMFVDVNPGDMIMANSFGPIGKNGGNVGNSARVSFLKNNVLTSSYAAVDVYGMYKTQGYVLAPEGIDEFNVTWASESSMNYLYVLKDLENKYDDYEISNKVYDYTTGNWITLGNSVSMTIDVEPGDKIIANSLHFSEINNSGNPGVDATRLVFFENDDVKFSLSPKLISAEYSLYGYITIPQGVNKINVSWWSASEDNYLYILK